MEKLRLLDLIIVIMVTLVCVLFYAIAEYLAKVLASRLFYLSKPLFCVVNTIIDNVLEGAFSADELVDWAHEVRKDTDSKKFDNHLEKVFSRRISLKVTVTQGGQGGDYEVNWLDVNFVVSFWFNCLVTVVAAATLGLQPRTLNCEANTYPEAA